MSNVCVKLSENEAFFCSQHIADHSRANKEQFSTHIIEKVFGKCYLLSSLNFTTWVEVSPGKIATVQVDSGGNNS